MNTTPDYLNDEIKRLKMRLDERAKEVETLQLRLCERDDEIARLIRVCEHLNSKIVRVPIKSEVQ